ncbi:lipocalin family protein [Mucilaginibacter ginsenosidivorans]|uniref:Lipocalin-like domain-containing protein n=1 Tax=Mucilaginibacter ginsenosidivorans TaxID=398053 RepID=A0A5B8V384_9SPHI|nr:lipocalin family protein [Mucilaginibacter ginsenosidivorans]QEC65273.1 hypothetical protein FRZ54_22770 [Mucilaginibacter ginsenosidivorans]
MRNKLLLLFLSGALFVGFISNSCKKTPDYLPTLITAGPWQLASTQVDHLVGDTLKSTDTLYADCSQTQVFTFNADGTCTFTNFSCKEQKTTGHWSFSADKLSLNCDMVCDSAGKSIKPFEVAQIRNLGQYSLVLRTGNLQAYYPPNAARIIRRYGFVRVKTQ